MLPDLQVRFRIVLPGPVFHCSNNLFFFLLKPQENFSQFLPGVKESMNPIAYIQMVSLTSDDGRDSGINRIQYSDCAFIIAHVESIVQIFKKHYMFFQSEIRFIVHLKIMSAEKIHCGFPTAAQNVEGEHIGIQYAGKTNQQILLFPAVSITSGGNSNLNFSLMYQMVKSDSNGTQSLAGKS